MQHAISSPYEMFFSPFDMAIQSAGEETRLPHGWKNGPMVRSSMAVQCCTRGEGTLIMEGQSFPVRRGECFITFPNVVLTEWANEKDPWGLLWICFNGTKFETCLNSLGINHTNPVLPCQYSTPLTNCIREVLALRANPELPPLLSEIQQMYQACALMLEIFRLCQADEVMPRISTTEGYVRATRAYIEENYEHTVKISEIADHIGLNRSYLYTIFKKHMGVSIQDYLISYRMKKACDFLALPQTTISSVAYSVGYDPLQFSKIFKRVLGVSPTDYRKSIGLDS